MSIRAHYCATFPGHPLTLDVAYRSAGSQGLEVGMGVGQPSHARWRDSLEATNYAVAEKGPSRHSLYSSEVFLSEQIVLPLA